MRCKGLWVILCNVNQVIPTAEDGASYWAELDFLSGLPEREKSLREEWEFLDQCVCVQKARKWPGEVIPVAVIWNQDLLRNWEELPAGQSWDFPLVSLGIPVRGGDISECGLCCGRGWGVSGERQLFWERVEALWRRGGLEGERLAWTVTCPQWQSAAGDLGTVWRLGLSLSPALHPVQRRHGRQPAWRAAGRWRSPRTGSVGEAGEQPSPRCCGSICQRGLGAGD